MKNILILGGPIMLCSFITLCFWLFGFLKLSWPNVLIMFHRVQGDFGLDTDTKIIIVPAVVFFGGIVVLAILMSIVVAIFSAPYTGDVA